MSENSNMICPSCGTFQQRADTCNKCGVIIAKALNAANNIDRKELIKPEANSFVKDAISNISLGGGMSKLLIFIAIGAVLYFGYQWRVNNEFSDANLAREVPIQSNKMGLPKAMGPVTLDSMSAEPGQRIIVKAIITVAPARALNVDKLLASKDTLTKPLCKDMWVLLAFKHGVTATYQIYGNDNTLATEITVTKTDCGL